MKRSTIKSAAKTTLVRELEVQVEPGPDGVLNCTVKPLGVDPETRGAMATLPTLTSDEDAIDVMAQFLSELIERWDLQEDDGTPVEPTFETFQSQFDPDELLTLIVKVQEALTGAPFGTSPSSDASERTTSRTRKGTPSTRRQKR